MLALSIKSVGPIKLEIPEDVEISKTVLYGYNGAGKSSIIRVLTMLLCGEECLTNLEKEMLNVFKKSLNVTLKSDKGFIGFKDEYIAGTDNDTRFRGSQIRKEAIYQYIGNYKVARVLTDRIYINGDEKDIHDTHDLSDMLGEPEFVEKIEGFFKYLDPGVSEFYYKKFRDKEEWLPIELLPYGYKRVLAMLYIIDRYDAVFIEGFEAGLHVDLIREFIDYVTENYEDKIVVIETHLGIALKFSLMRGWKVYYVSREDIEKLDLQKLHGTKLFVREMEALK